MQSDHETIVAIATAPGKSGVGILRLSGKNSLTIGEKISKNKLIDRAVVFTGFFDSYNNCLDKGLAIYFKSPNSYTGEDVVELQCHGSPVVLDKLLALCLEFGAKTAKPGEFTERAFLNNKIDLAQAEAVADLINSSSEQAAIAASQTLQGSFSNHVNTLIDRLIYIRSFVESALDFPDEEIELLNNENIISQLDELKKLIEETLSEAQQGMLMTEGMTAVIVGKPNAGKSSLLNALANKESAIVTHIPGTTRDVLRENILLDGLPLHIIDTAGLRESDDPVEQEGIRRAILEIENANRILFVRDLNQEKDKESGLSDIWPPLLGPVPAHIPVTVINNKCDIAKQEASLDNDQITLSAKTGDGLNLLKKHLKQVMGYEEGNSGKFSARRRHLDALRRALEKIITSIDLMQSSSGNELLAEELRLAQQDLEAITGRFTPDDLLDKIFRDFCIGK